MTEALKLHNSGKTTVVPIVVRSCVWEGAPFAKLRMAPTDARPVTTWPDRDQAWTDVSKSIRSIVTEWRIEAKPERPVDQLQAQLRALLEHWQRRGQIEGRGQIEDALFGSRKPETIAEIARLEFELEKFNE
jgi:hypothetical protein